MVIGDGLLAVMGAILSIVATRYSAGYHPERHVGMRYACVVMSIIKVPVEQV